MRVVFTEDRLVLPDEEEKTYDEIFNRKSDAITLHAQHVEMVDRCYWDVDVVVALQKGTLTIGNESLDPKPVKHWEVTTSEITIPREAMGFGDVKFMGAIGAFLGWQATLFTLMVSSIVGATVGVFLILVGKSDWGKELPYGPYIALAAVVWIFGGYELWDWYWGRICLAE